MEASKNSEIEAVFAARPLAFRFAYGLMFIVSALVTVGFIHGRQFNFDGFFVVGIAWLITIYIYYWSKRIKIVIYKDRFDYINFFSNRNFYYDRITRVEIKIGHNGPFSPVNMLRIETDDSRYVEINRLIFEEGELDFLLSKIDANHSAELGVNARKGLRVAKMKRIGRGTE